MSLGNRIKELRGDENQSSFGERFGKNRNTIRRYEINKKPPDATFLAALCCVFEVSPAWLLLGEGEKRTSSGMRNKKRKTIMVTVKMERSFVVNISDDRNGTLTTMDLIKRSIQLSTGCKCPDNLEITDIII